MKLNRSILIIPALCLTVSSLAAPKRSREIINEDANKRIRLSEDATDLVSSSIRQTQTYAPGRRSEETPCELGNSVHFSKIPFEFLTAIASYLSLKDMAKLSEVGWIPNHIVALAASRLESFQLRKDESIIDQLKFLSKASGGKNTHLKALDSYDVHLTETDIEYITDHFSNLENFRVPHGFKTVATLQNFLKAPDGTRNLKNETLKVLDVTQVNLDESDTKWISDHFPNAPINYITPLKIGDELYDALPEEFIELGPNNIYQIRDPKGVTLPFILSHVSDERMNHERAFQFCKSKGGRLPSKEEYSALGRAMTYNGKYCSSLIDGTSGNFFWSSSVHPCENGDAFNFNGLDGIVSNYSLVNSFYVRCAQ